jgi:hypothetical protein
MTFMHTCLAHRAKYGCDMSDMIDKTNMSTDVEMQVRPVLDQHFCVTLPVHASVCGIIFLTMITICVYLLRLSHRLPPDAEEFSGYCAKIIT